MIVAPAREPSASELKRPFIGWRGRSLLTGDRIALVFTSGSANEKTGPMWQTWLLCEAVPPFEAVKTRADAAICGGCARRGFEDETKRSCYVNLFTGPSQIWRALQAGRYPELSPSAIATRLAGQHVRVTAYGDPVSLPFVFWSTVLQRAAGWTGYTHLWRICDQQYRGLLMASADSVDEQAEASLMGWRTFRVRSSDEPVQPWEFRCPASEELGHRTTCLKCQLCRGQASPAKSVAILVHGRQTAHGTRGKYDGLKAQLERGERAEVTDTPRGASRMLLALRQAYRRRGDQRTVRRKTTGVNTFQVWLS